MWNYKERERERIILWSKINSSPFKSAFGKSAQMSLKCKSTEFKYHTEAGTERLT